MARRRRRCSSSWRQRQRRRQNVDQASGQRRAEELWRSPTQPLHFTIHTNTISRVAYAIQHGRRDFLHVFPPPNGPAAPGDRPPVHALLHKHIMSRRARGYVKVISRIYINHTNQHSQTATLSPRAPLPTHTLHATPSRCPDPRSPKPPTAQTSPKSSATTLPAAHHTTSPSPRNSSRMPWSY